MQRRFPADTMHVFDAAGRELCHARTPEAVEFARRELRGTLVVKPEWQLRRERAERLCTPKLNHSSKSPVTGATPEAHERAMPFPELMCLYRAGFRLAEETFNEHTITRI